MWYKLGFSASFNQNGVKGKKLPQEKNSHVFNFELRCNAYCIRQTILNFLKDV